MAWLSTWNYRKEITIDATNVDADLTWFPILLKLGSSVGQGIDDVTDIFDEVGANSQKIAITSSDGETQLYVEVERWNSGTETAELWVSKSDLVIDSDTGATIYLYYDNTQADNTDYIGVTPNDTPTNNVWDSNFEAVHHLVGAAATNLDDSTSNNNDFTLDNGTPVYNNAAQIGLGIDLERSSSEYITAPEGTLDNTGAMTYSIWCNSEDNSQSYYYLAVKGDPPNPQLGFKNADLSNKCFFSVYNEGFYTAQGSVLNTATDYLLTGRYDPSDSAAGVEVFVNGTSAGTSSAPASVSTNDGLLYLGASPYGNYFDGLIDELRISNIARPDAWIKADYYCQKDDFVSWGTTERNVRLTGPFPLHYN